jgi:uncharacterized protein (DUF2336 family)
MARDAAARVEKQLDPAREIADAEVARLFELAREKSKAGRASLFSAIAELFERRGEALHENERRLMAEILRRLSREVEAQLRHKLAERLAGRADAPRELVVMLANDEIEVAYPILAESPALRDVDLIEVVRHRTLQHQLAVAIRKDLSENVSEALVETGQEDVIVALLGNADARISGAVLQHLAEESKRVDRYQTPLVRRPDLPREVARRMCMWVSAAVRKHIVEHYEIDPHDLDDEIAGAASEVAAEAEAEADAQSPAQSLVQKLHDAGELTAGFVLKSLSQGQITLFELSFARLTGLRPVLLRRIVYEPGGEGLAILCRAIGVDAQVFLSMYRLTRKARAVVGQPSPAELRLLVEFYDNITAGAAKLLLRKWLRDKDYLDALRALYDG